MKEIKDMKYSFYNSEQEFPISHVRAECEDHHTLATILISVRATDHQSKQDSIKAILDTLEYNNSLKPDINVLGVRGEPGRENILVEVAKERVGDVFACLGEHHLCSNAFIQRVAAFEEASLGTGLSA